jgi:nucleotide-binding universal stress UspA family protein
MNQTARVSEERVLVALDGSPAAATALPWARTVARQLGARVEILHVTDDTAPALELCQQLHHDLEEPETVHVRSHTGTPAEAILDEASRPGVALLVLTTHGRTIESGRQLGHVTETVIATTERPVLLVRPEATVGVGQTPAKLERLLLPVDGTPTTASALPPVTDLAARLRASIDLVYVAGPHQALPLEPGSMSAPFYVDQPQYEWPEWAQEGIERLCRGLAKCPASVPVRMFLAEGEIGPTIARFAAEHRADAVALVRRSHFEPGRAHVLRSVLAHSPSPVLLVSGSS